MRTRCAPPQHDQVMYVAAEKRVAAAHIANVHYATEANAARDDFAARELARSHAAAA